MIVDERLRADLPSRLARIRLRPGGEAFVQLCQEIAVGLKFRQVGLWVGDDAPGLGAGAQFQWPAAGEPAMTSKRGFRHEPIVLAGRTVATLILPARAVRRLDAESRRILAGVVDLLGPVLVLARLEAERDDALARARDQAERIAASRRQAFAERDRERLELERDLHDGAQHHLVALRMAVGLLEIQIENGDLAAAGSVLTGLRSSIEQAQQTLIRTAAGNCPPVLVDNGLIAALRAEFSAVGRQIDVISEIADEQRYSLTAETAVYFTCLEAVNNARKHALGANIRVEVKVASDGLTFTVTDDGPGLGAVAMTDSFGLGNMRSRIQAAGGQLELITVRGAGTTVAGTIPHSCLRQ